MSIGRIRRHIPFLNDVLDDPEVVRHASFIQLEVLVEIVYNIVNNSDVLLSKKEVRILREHKALLTTLSRVRYPDEARKLLLKLPYDVIQSLIDPVVDLIGDLYNE